MVWKIKKIIFIQFIQVFQILILLSEAVQRCVYNDVNLYCHKTADKECLFIQNYGKP